MLLKSRGVDLSQEHIRGWRPDRTKETTSSESKMEQESSRSAVSQRMNTDTVNSIDEMIAKIKSLQPGYTLMFGSAFKVPIISKFDMPNPTPYSRNVDISNTWYKNE